MIRRIGISAAVLALVISGAGLLSQSIGITRVGPHGLLSDVSAAQSESAVQAALQSQIQTGDDITLSTTAISGDWALQMWQGDNIAGEALLEYNEEQDQWSLVSWGGGEWDAGELVQEGVPQSDAATLVADMSN